MIPDWTGEGLLPPGVHPATWAEVVARYSWNARRSSLLLGLLDGLKALAVADCSALWLDGSFVSNKELPGDYDACWDPTGMNGSRIDPRLLDFSPSGRHAIKSKYLGDLLIAGVEQGSGLAFVDFFQQTRDGRAKGIILLDPQEHR
jgi:hypothetical protein